MCFCIGKEEFGIGPCASNTGDCRIFATCKTKNRIANHINSVGSHDSPTPISHFRAKIEAMMGSAGAVPLLQVLSTFRQLQQTQAPKYSYLVKFIQAKKSEFMVRMWHNMDEQFSSLTGLQLKLMDYFQDKLPATTNSTSCQQPTTSSHQTTRNIGLWSNAIYRKSTDPSPLVP